MPPIEGGEVDQIQTEGGDYFHSVDSYYVSIAVAHNQVVLIISYVVKGRLCFCS